MNAVISISGSRWISAFFNFGYLPHGDPEIMTRRKTSLCAATKALHLLKKHGILILVLYWGQACNREESEALLAWSAGVAKPLLQRVQNYDA